MVRTPDLSSAVEGLYRAFEGYPLREDTNPCSCCHSPQDEQRIRSKMLRVLEAKDLGQFAWDALYVWGNEEDFKHFLPRILELLIDPDAEWGFVDPHAIFAKLTYSDQGSTHWRSWPDREHTAIREYLHAVWFGVLETDPEERRNGAYDWICAVSQAEEDIKPYLHVWLAAESVNAHRNLAAMIVHEGVPNLLKPSPGYWDKCREQWQQLIGWLRQPSVRKKLEAAIDKWAGEPFAGELYDAAVLLP